MNSRIDAPEIQEGHSLSTFDYAGWRTCRPICLCSRGIRCRTVQETLTKSARFPALWFWEPHSSQIRHPIILPVDEFVDCPECVGFVMVQNLGLTKGAHEIINGPFRSMINRSHDSQYPIYSQRDTTLLLAVLIDIIRIHS